MYLGFVLMLIGMALLLGTVTPVTSGCGTGYQGTLIHAPNENIRLADYWDAMRCMGAFIRAFAEV